MKLNPVFCPAVWATVVAVLLPASSLVSKASPGLDLARQLNEAFVEVAESVSKSVVVIHVRSRGDRMTEPEGNPFLEQMPEEQRERMEQFFEFFQGQGRGGRRPKGRESEGGGGSGGSSAPLVSGQGSGMVISKEGYILTNNHVVEGAEEIVVSMRDGREIKAEIRGRDPESDLAVIRLKESLPDLVPVRFADSDKVRVGEFAIAIGAPFRLEYSVTFGHVSAKGREVGEMRELTDQDFLQTDATINVGNSGGPLVNIDGQVIGVNSMIRTSMGAPVGIGFAIPSNLAREISSRLIDDGVFSRSWLGISIADLREFQQLQEIQTKATNGVLVRQIQSGGPAEKTELRAADVIIAVDGKPTPNTRILRAMVSRKKSGTAVILDVVRGDETVKVKVTAGERPTQDQMAAARRPKQKKEAPVMELGMTVRELTEELSKKYKVDRADGVIITEIEPGSLAERFELKVGDVVTDINHEPVTNVKEFREEIRKVKGRVLVSFIRDGNKQFEVLKERSK